MTHSMRSPAQRATKIKDEGAGDIRRQRGADDDTAFGRFKLDGFEVDPSNYADEVIFDFDGHAFHEHTVNDFWLRHARPGPLRSHASSPPYALRLIFWLTYSALVAAVFIAAVTP